MRSVASMTSRGVSRELSESAGPIATMTPLSIAIAPRSTNPTPSPAIVRMCPPVINVSYISLPSREYRESPGFERAINLRETCVAQPGELISGCRTLVERHP